MKGNEQHAKVKIGLATYQSNTHYSTILHHSEKNPSI